MVALKFFEQADSSQTWAESMERILGLRQRPGTKDEGGIGSQIRGEGGIGTRGGGGVGAQRDAVWVRGSNAQQVKRGEAQLARRLHDGRRGQRHISGGQGGGGEAETEIETVFLEGGGEFVRREGRQGEGLRERVIEDRRAAIWRCTRTGKRGRETQQTCIGLGGGGHAGGEGAVAVLPGRKG